MLQSYPAEPASHEEQGDKKKVARYELEGWQPALLVLVWVCRLCRLTMSFFMQSWGGDGPCGASQGDGTDRQCRK